MKQESIFSEIPDLPKDPIFGLLDTYRKDNRPNKIDLTVGIYLEEDGALPKIFQSVKLAEKEILETEATKNYLPIDGDPEFVEATGKFIFGNEYSDRIYGAQAVGGTAALRILGEFIKGGVSDEITHSSPTWPNHTQVFRRIGLKVDSYPYWNGKFDFNRMVDYLTQQSARTVVLLQPACHNPTGWDLSMNEWKILSELFHKKGLIPFFDSAYQGIGQGVNEDVEPIRFFVREGHECLVAHSFAKSMGLYSERVGALYIVMQSSAMKDKIKRNINALIRTQNSNPPKHGAAIAKLLFTKPEINRIWMSELDKIRFHLNQNRQLLAERLGEKYNYIRGGHGFFSLLGLTPKQVDILRDDYAIYMTAASRINLAAINSKNIDYVVDSIKKLP